MIAPSPLLPTSIALPFVWILYTSSFSMIETISWSRDSATHTSLLARPKYKQIDVCQEPLASDYVALGEKIVYFEVMWRVNFL